MLPLFDKIKKICYNIYVIKKGKSFKSMNELERIKYLIDYLNQTTKAYDEGHPEISDEEWDTLYFELKALEESSGIVMTDSPTQVVNYQIVNSLEKVEHNHKMLSLDKTKELDVVKAFLGEHDYLAMCKMDGLTCSLHYVGGKLVSAETRGNGIIGENILHNALVISSIPNKIQYTDDLIVDGEIICSYDDFEKFSNEYKNPRNFASGSIRLLDSKECESRKLKFVAWDVIEGFEESTLHGKLQHLLYLGFTIVPYIENYGCDPSCVEYIKQMAKDANYPIDGVVFKFDNIAYGKSLGETSHHFKNAIAFKFYDETYPSTLIDIEWTMGRTGILTPVAVFDPIDIDGSTVERASLHNISVMEELSQGFERRGDIVHIYKANMIIPQVKSWEHIGDYSEEKHINIPTTCPICGHPTKISISDSGVKNLICENPQCAGKLINRLDHFCGKKGLDIKGLSKATLEKLIDWGWVDSIKDIYSLTSYRDEWIHKPGFGVKSVTNILTAIENSKHCELSSFICALGIPLIGSTYAKALSKLKNGWFQIREDIKSHLDFTKYDSFGPEMCVSLWNFDYTEADFLSENVLDIKNSLWKDPSMKEEDASLNNISVVITGKLSIFKNRAALQSAIEAAGGKVVGSVSKNTNYLINNDSTSTSSKNMSAQKLGIPIVTEAEFVEKFLKNFLT